MNALISASVEALLNRSGIDKKTVDAILVEFDREKGTRKGGVEG